MVWRLHPLQVSYYSEVVICALYSVIVSLIADASRNVGAEGWLIGFIAGVYSYSALFSNLLLGYISDKFGRPLTLFIADIFYSILSGITGLYPNKWYILVIRLLTGCFAGIVSVGIAGVKDYSKTKEQSNKLMIWVVLSMGIGYIIGPLLIIILSLAELKFDLFCLILGLVSLIGTIILSVLVPETRKVGGSIQKKRELRLQNNTKAKNENFGDEPEQNSEKRPITQNYNSLDHNSNEEDLELIEIKDQELEEKITETTSKEEEEEEEEDEDDDNNDDQDDNKDNKEREEESNKEEEDQSKQEKESKKEIENVSQKNHGNEIKKSHSFKELINKDLVLLLFLYFLFNIPRISLISASSLLVKDIFKLNPSTYAPLIVLTRGLMITISAKFFVKWAIKKFGTLWSFCGAAFVCTILLVCCAYIKQFWGFLVIYAAFCFILSIHTTLTASLIVYVAPKQAVGRVMGFAQVLASVAKGVGPLVTISIYLKSVTVFFYVCAALTLIQIPTIMLINVSKDSKEGKETTKEGDDKNSLIKKQQI
ncbi:major facilitator superfamily domain-containing protein [Anaeramoeba flamelloides]|uniref:Major facilitator superfamily domain-containing protein n=1 Tax=Anaeramoeba flamelloides TaxID=1746091 RepID=A0AAV7YIA9_9EUKA|nr:major facilitator superfamily domain-containing protein [Anaeramoeba flamelloides]